MPGSMARPRSALCVPGKPIQKSALGLGHIKGVGADDAEQQRPLDDHEDAGKGHGNGGRQEAAPFMHQCLAGERHGHQRDPATWVAGAAAPPSAL